MDSLIKKLENEVGLTEEQAIKSIQIIKNYIVENGSTSNHEKSIKDRYGDLKSVYKNMTDKLVDKIDNLTTQTKDLSHKASNMFKEEE